MSEHEEFVARSQQLAADSPSGWQHTGPWVCAQRWEQVLFLHWPVSVAEARSLIPPEADVEIDTYDGQAYVSVLSLRMARVHLRDLLPIPDLGDFPELNVRTYVVRDGKPGVWFVSLDVPSHLNAWIGRHVFHLAYDVAGMHMTDTGGHIDFVSDRERGTAQFSADYTAAAGAAPAAPGSLEQFLAERYCMYTLSHEQRLKRADIEHRPWQLRPVDVNVLQNTVLQGDHITVTGQPARAMYADWLENVVWLPVSP